MAQNSEHTHTGSVDEAVQLIVVYCFGVTCIYLFYGLQLLQCNQPIIIHCKWPQQPASILLLMTKPQRFVCSLVVAHCRFSLEQSKGHCWTLWGEVMQVPQGTGLPSAVFDRVQQSLSQCAHHKIKPQQRKVKRGFQIAFLWPK